ncbi:1664_t:CDS:2 [Funneliformis mosseae]|uniref:1664_t:CDS:1 n=1 Tax=Funneliformis mosseae TaxID=27381 RepID=A0A9N9GXN7_FUNMO|nr:1664_t:CDS:2 [Funneliformis mosseae]
MRLLIASRTEEITSDTIKLIRQIELGKDYISTSSDYLDSQDNYSEDLDN